MSDKDEIKELFQKELGNYQAKVDPSLWNGIQAGIGATSATAGTTASIGIVGKIAIGVSIVTAITVGSVFVLNNTEEKSQITKTLKTEKESSDQVSEEKETIEVIQSTTEIEPEEINEKIQIETEEVVEKDALKVEDHSTVTQAKKQNIVQSATTKTDSIQSSANVENEATTVVRKAESKVEDKIKEVTQAPDKEEVSELEDFEIAVVEQKNQYVTFKSENVPENAYIVWDFGDGVIERTKNPEYFYAEAGNYRVQCTVKTESEEKTKSIQIEIKISGKIELPNVFTPNGDGRNDEFFVKCENINSMQLTIIDQKQNTVYTTNDVDFRWNGMDKNGLPVEAGIYYYIIVAEDDAGNTINKYQQLRIHR
ncbi:T9SS type B sorting domain-containing protein [Brumimicrobium aurantiacum]|uniref:PKD domain-containing protein n=1 Tax=Brumimicrobium aurantiacum TaxID=1737063 RepID=A0A3E1F258_9FLAO|nr:gliding motility-associated C-terminal domain-containing protein [Brumimicrobium aurantiacum]RFC55880.1 PKD domain-containing protein [Brumimicrobium aurantiacum]